MLRSLFLATLFLLLAAPRPPANAAGDPAEAGRQILERNQNAVVTVKLVVNYRMSFGGHEQKSESKSETIGTVIDPAGLTVISLSAIDPSATVEELFSRQMRRNGQKADFKIDSDVTDLKLVLANGTELDSIVVLRDKDLDLAYIRPKTKPKDALTHVDLAGDPTAKVLEEVVTIYRLGKVANRVPTVSLERINAIVDRPRLFYVLGPGQGSSAVGSPVFRVDGKLLGIVLIRTLAPEGDANFSAMFSGPSSLGLLPIIVPTADIRDGAKQTAETK